MPWKRRLPQNLFWLILQVFYSSKNSSPNMSHRKYEEPRHGSLAFRMSYQDKTLKRARLTTMQFPGSVPPDTGVDARRSPRLVGFQFKDNMMLGRTVDGRDR